MGSGNPVPSLTQRDFVVAVAIRCLALDGASVLTDESDVDVWDSAAGCHFSHQPLITVKATGQQYHAAKDSSHNEIRSDSSHVLTS